MAKIPTLKHLPDVNLSLSLMLEAQLASEALTNEMETRIAKIRDEYADRLSGLAGDYQAEKKMVEAYLKAHKDDFEGPPRSVELAHGTVGFRLGQKHLEPLSKWSWAKVLAKLQADKAKRYLRPTEEVDRDVLQADAQKLGEAKMRTWGLKVAQDDKPFIDLKREEATHA